LIKSFKKIWSKVRELSGDDAYERYLQHYEEYHQDDAEQAALPLTKEAFFKEWQDKKWTGVKRCC
jgi:uncharacterized short protein YbdD (DUF466 family)